MVKNIQEQRTDRHSVERQKLIEHYQHVRNFSRYLCETLEIEDYVIQSMPDVSPTKWHLAHTTWFFETFLLAQVISDYVSPNKQYAYLFNSYYNALGKRHSRPHRGLISRPTVQATYDYRRYVDEHMLRLLQHCDDKQLTEIEPIVTLGIHHEQQHQELMLTDIKHVFSCNPLYPVYREQTTAPSVATSEMQWISYPEGIEWIGHEGTGFFYDNEEPRHRTFLEPFLLGSRLVTNGEYLTFIENGGYTDPLLWLSAGWNTVQQEGWSSPAYWEMRDGEWWTFTLHGLQPVNPADPVCHVSYYEADAFARWANARLATEAEWERAARDLPIAGNFVENAQFHPVPLTTTQPSAYQPEQMYGDVWEWTQSAYLAYPGYKPAEGAIGEYNGKFMSNQFVLRGGSCATSQTHIRSTYRNFFPPDARWQFSGIRLARDLS